MQHALPGLPPAIFVVMLSEVLVARDIEMIIRDLRPEAQVVLLSSLQETATVPRGPVWAIFAQTDVTALAASELARRVAPGGGRMVLVGHEAAESLPDGWRALPLPFATLDVAALVAGTP